MQNKSTFSNHTYKIDEQQKQTQKYRNVWSQNNYESYDPLDLNENDKGDLESERRLLLFSPLITQMSKNSEPSEDRPRKKEEWMSCIGGNSNTNKQENKQLQEKIHY